MTLLINSYSFIALGGLILLGIVFLTWNFVGPKTTLFTGVVTAILLVYFQSLTYTTENTFSRTEDFNNVLTSGNPVLLELYSNF